MGTARADTGRGATNGTPDRGQEGGEACATQNAARTAELPLAGRTMNDLGRQVAEWRERVTQAEADLAADREDYRRVLAEMNDMVGKLEQAEAECARLNLLMDDDAKEYIRLEAERDQWKATWEEWRAIAAGYRADNARLREALEARVCDRCGSTARQLDAFFHCATCYRNMQARAAQAEAERDRLRAALESARGALDCPHGEGCDPSFNYGHRCVMCDDNVDGDMELRHFIDATLLKGPEVLAQRARRCATCRHHDQSHVDMSGRLSCLCLGRMVTPDWFCADWTTKEEPDHA